MTCPTCQHWTATSKSQLQRRLDNIARFPQVGVHHCPDCGATDWATTNEFIVTNDKRWNWRLFGWLPNARRQSPNR